MEMKEILLVINDKINTACIKAGRNPNEITIIAISKKQTVTAINEAISLGITNIGESYVQEFLEKKQAVSNQNIHWHFVGQLQSNKVKYLKDNVEYIHSVYKESVLSEIDKRLDNVKIFLEINIDNEDSKGGIRIKEINNFFDNVIPKYKIKPIGLMCIPPFDAEPQKSRKYFSQLKDLMHSLNKEYKLDMNFLSMGMSSDFDIAIQEGATHIRIGTLIFGERK